MKKSIKTVLSVVLTLALCLGLFPLSAGAAQANEYHDPAENWIQSSGRMNELDANAIISYNTSKCNVCHEATLFQAFRVPEYTKNGSSDMLRGILYSDGTLNGGDGTATLNDGIPGVDAYYTGYHWTKSVCSKCGTINSNIVGGDYCVGKNVYYLNDCASSFDEQTLPESTEWECLDNSYHYKTVTTGTYCGFCFGTRKNSDTRTEAHTMQETVRSELGHTRFMLVSDCAGCSYSKTSYALAKAVVSNYEGVVDGQPHTITVSDLSEDGVTAKIRYGNSAESCTLTSAPNYIDAGSYPVFYEITYTYKNTDMVENGVAYVRLAGDVSGDGSCEDGNHNFTLLETVAPSCTALGYDRYLCPDCGMTERRNFTNAVGHLWQSVLIREADCENKGKVLNICQRCGETEVTYTDKGEHEYATHTVAPSCTNPGYTVKECSVCGDRHITDITNALAHNYKAKVTPPGCLTGGWTTHLCENCGSSFVTDYTEPAGHTFDGGTKVTVPTCMGEGVTEYRCTRCGYHYLEAVSAKGHTPGAPATCNEDQTCTVCGAILEKAHGHKKSDWIVDREPTEDVPGSRHKECVHCGKVMETETVECLTVKHAAYIYGYPDGDFGPEDSMTRAEASAIFARLLAEETGDTLTRSASTGYADVPSNAWYSGAVRYLTNKGIAVGRGNNRYAPEAKISRSEFTTMAVRFFSVYRGGDETLKEQYKGFTDVSSGYWAAQYIHAAAENGWIKGYIDGSFRGDSSITRAEAVTIVNRLLGRTADKDYIQKNVRRINTFTDVSEKHWAYWEILEAANGHSSVKRESGENWQ